MTRNVIVEIDSGKRRLATVVIGAERQGQCAATPRLVLEGGDERAANATQTAILPDDERVQFPDTSVVLREAADPPKRDVVLQCGEGEALVDHPLHLRGRRRHARPSPWLVEALDKQYRGLLAHNFRLGTDFGNPHIDGSWKTLGHRCRNACDAGRILQAVAGGQAAVAAGPCWPIILKSQNDGDRRAVRLGPSRTAATARHGGRSGP